MSHEMNGARSAAAAKGGRIRAHVTGWGRYVPSQVTTMPWGSPWASERTGEAT